MEASSFPLTRLQQDFGLTIQVECFNYTGNPGAPNQSEQDRIRGAVHTLTDSCNVREVVSVTMSKYAGE